MRVLIIGAGPDSLPLKSLEADYVIALDGGILVAEAHGLTLDAAFSDGDSSSLASTIVRYPFIHTFSPVKDESDLDLALDSLARGELLPLFDITRLDAHGVLGGRMDHALAACCSLYRHPTLPLHLRDRENDIWLGQERFTITKGEWRYFALFSFRETTISIEGAKYPLHDYRLLPGDNLCLSNELQGEEAIITTDHPLVVVQSERRQ